MSKQEYNKQSIIKYLLGSLPGAESEHFDELSFIDDDFADALKSTEKDLIDSYIQGELTGETLENFKTNYLASPLRREKVKFAESFQIYAEKERAKTGEQNAVIEEAKAEKNTGFFPFISNLFASMNALQWGFAAVVLAIIAIGGFWLISKRSVQNGDDTIAKQNTPAPNNQGSPRTSSSESPAAIPPKETPPINKEPELAQQKNATEQTNKPQVVKTPEIPKQETSPNISRAIIASLILPPPLRGSGGGGRGQLPIVSLPDQNGDVAIHLELEADEYPNYRVSLIDQNGKQLWNSGSKLKAKSAGEKKLLNIRFPAKLLKSQIFSLAVSGVPVGGGEGEIISNYPFRAVVK